MALTFSAIRQRVIDTFVELASIRSPLLEVGKIMDHMETIVRDEFGFGFQYDQAGATMAGFERGNMIVDLMPAIPGFESLPVKGVEAHVDTVPVEGPSVKVVVADDVIRTDGTTILGADNKAGVTAIIEALRLIREHNIPHGPIQWLITVGEERSMYGVRQADFGLIKAQEILCMDGLEGNTIWRSCAAKLKYRAIFHGKEGHGAFPERGLSALIMAIQALGASIHQGLLGNHNDFGVIHGSTYETSVWHNLAELLSHTKGKSMFPSTNVIVPEVIVSGEFRAFSKKLLEETFAQLRNNFEDWSSRSRSQDGQAKGSVEIETEYPYEPFLLAEDNPLTQSVMGAMVAADVPNPSSGIIAGATHSNVWNMHGIPSVCLGAGCRNPHENSEHVIIDEMVRAAEVIAHWLAAPAGQ